MANYQRVAGSFVFNGSDISDSVTNFSITMRRNEAANWSLTLNNSLGTFSDGDSFISVGSPITKYLIATLNVEDYSFSIPPFLIPTRYNYQTFPPRVTISGTDFTRVLYGSKTIASYISTASSPWFCSQIVADILANKLTESIPCRLEFAEVDFNSSQDYPVKLLNIQQEYPLDVINRLFEIPRIDWHWEGKTFVAKKARYDKTITGIGYDFQDAVNIFTLSIDYSIENIINIIEVKRGESTGILAEKEEMGGDILGRREITWSTPGFGVTPQFLIKLGCEIDSDSYEWRNAQTGVWQTNKLYANPCNGFRFYVDTLPYQTSGIPHYKCRIYGWSGEDLMFPDDDREKYACRYRDQSLISKYGELPAPEPITNTLIPSYRWCQIHAQAMLEDAKKNIYISSLQTFSCPHLQPGDTISITEVNGNISDRFFIQEVSHNFSPGNYKTTIKAGKYV